MLLADNATTRYSMVAPDAFAENTAHPDVWVGSIVVSAATPSVIWPLLAAVQGASGGCVGPLELQAAARHDHSPTPHRCFAIA